MSILQRLMARVFGPAKPRSPRYMYELEDGVFVESIFPDFKVNVPMPQRGRFAPKTPPGDGAMPGGENGAHPPVSA